MKLALASLAGPGSKPNWPYYRRILWEISSLLSCSFLLAFCCSGSLEVHGRCQGKRARDWHINTDCFFSGHPFRAKPLIYSSLLNSKDQTKNMFNVHLSQGVSSPDKRAECGLLKSTHAALILCCIQCRPEPGLWLSATRLRKALFDSEGLTMSTR